MGTGGSFPGGKARPGRDADHSSPFSAEVKCEWELYLLSPHVPPWRVAGTAAAATYVIKSVVTRLFAAVISLRAVRRWFFFLTRVRCFVAKCGTVYIVQ
jgi:hypothetical protein